jgi:hypothetical protein
MVSFTSRPLYPRGKNPWRALDRRLSWPLRQSEVGGEENSTPRPYWKSYPGRPARRLVSVLTVYEGVSKSFRTGRLERGLQMVQLSATRCSCIAILWVSLVSFAAITLYVASQRVFLVIVVYFVIDSVRKLLNTPSYDNPTI